MSRREVSQDRKNKMLTALREGKSYDEALEAADFSSGHISYWRQRWNQGDKDFFEAYNEALDSRASSMVPHCEDQLYKKALNGNLSAINRILQKHGGDRWKPPEKSEGDTDSKADLDAELNLPEGASLNEQHRAVEAAIKDTQKAIKKTR